MDEFCTECGKLLKEKSKIVWLELNMSTNEYRRVPPYWPEEESQGIFPFGAACAKTVLKNKGQCVKELGAWK